MIRRPPRSTRVRSSAASDVYKRQGDVADAEPWMDGSLEEDDHGVVERIKFRGVRRTMARRMAEARDKQALVTTTEEADVSVVKRIREKERTLASERGIKLTYLAFVV